MNVTRIFALGFLALAVGCASSSSTPDAPIIDSLDVPATTTQLTLNGQTGPGVIATLTAHDPGAGITTLHFVFAESGVDQPLALPGSPTTITAQKIEIIALGAPSGPHVVSFHLTNANGVNSAVISKTITVP
jgi:hypothetical protein